MRMLFVLLLFAAVCPAQEQESRERWHYFQEVSYAPEGRTAIELDVDTLGGARTDHADLRLYDQTGREVPYALRVRSQVYRSEIVDAQQLDLGVRAGRSQVTLDLGESRGVHNEIEIDLAGQNFRRAVEVQGSDDAQGWATLIPDGIVFRFAAAGRSVDQNVVAYPDSRYRYLRALVSPDPAADGGRTPTIREIRARQRVETEGVEHSYLSAYAGREPVSEAGRPASRYVFQLNDSPIPIHSLTLSLNDAPFSRPYRLLYGGRDHSRYSQIELASGLLASEEEGYVNVVLSFPEAFVQELTLIVTDDRNPALQISSAQPAGAARHLVFENDGLAFPLRLYFGNPDAALPRYDYDKLVPAVLREGPEPQPLGPRRINPDYRAPQPPITERAPWLIYVALAAATLALLWLLRGVVQVAGRPVEP